MTTPQTSEFIKRDNRKYAKSNGISRNCKALGFLPAFKDSVTGEIYLSRFADGSTAPIHMLDGMPDHWVIERDADDRVLKIRGSITAGFIRDGRYYSREELANAPLDS